jgi:hypothetical protein
VQSQKPPKKELEMISRFIVSAICLISVGLASAASAQQFEYKDYQVQRGDTLWDISRAHIEDPFQWPLIWRENQRINDPDRIYPGQWIRIPVRVLGPEEQALRQVPVERPEAPKAVERPAEEERLIGRDILAASGYISKTVPYEGEITGSPTARAMFGKDDEVYIKSARPAAKGDRFYVIRNTGSVKHPVTGDWLGYLVNLLGVLEVEKVDADVVTARVTETFDAVRTGDVLDAYYDMEPLVLSEPPRMPQVEGAVVASKYFRVLNGMFDVVYLDRGRDDGLLAGDMLRTLAPGTQDRPNGLMRIISLRETTSTAVLVRSDVEVRAGDRVSGLK